MNPETLAHVIVTALNDMEKMIQASTVDAEALAIALENDTATDEQMTEFTRLAHFRFDLNLGCIVDGVIEMCDNGVPHYAINHAIRTYVRAVDKREAGFKVCEG